MIQVSLLWSGFGTDQQTMSLAQQAALDDLAQHLYDFLPGKATLMLTKVFRSLASPRRWDLKNTGQAEANSLPFVVCLVLSLLQTETSLP